jgi:hypothetical protein
VPREVLSEDRGGLQGSDARERVGHEEFLIRYS